jgi:hypothetical protein
MLKEAAPVTIPIRAIINSTEICSGFITASAKDKACTMLKWAVNQTFLINDDKVQKILPS